MIWAPPLPKQKKRTVSRTTRATKKPKTKMKAKKKSRPQPQSSSPSLPQLEIPPPRRRAKPDVPEAKFFVPLHASFFDLPVDGSAVAFRGDVYQLVSGVPVQSVRINGYHFPIREEAGQLIARIRHFAKYEVEILQSGATTTGLRFHVIETNDNWPPK